MMLLHQASKSLLLIKHWVDLNCYTDILLSMYLIDILCCYLLKINFCLIIKKLYVCFKKTRERKVNDDKLSCRSLRKLTNCWLSHSSLSLLSISFFTLSLSLSLFLSLSLNLYLYRPLLCRPNSIGKVTSSNSLSNTTNQLALSLS
jgi:hypothetical protein